MDFLLKIDKLSNLENIAQSTQSVCQQSIASALLLPNYIMLISSHLDRTNLVHKGDTAVNLLSNAQ